MNKKQLEAEINWLIERINSGKCTKKQIKEYKRQIRHKQLTITLDILKDLK